jgi:DNA-directed RNA polymerase specialized sigma24 family protein
MERTAYSSQKDALTQEAFDLLLARLHPEREQAGGRYAALRLKMVRFFTLHDDYGAEEAADETLDRVARKLAEGAQVEGIEPYAYSIARLILLERNKRERRARAAFDRSAGPDEPAAADEPAAPEDYYQPMADCLAGLPDDDQKLLRGYYGEINARRRAALADGLGVSLARLRLRVFRLRARLEECLKRKRAAIWQNS